MTQYHTHSSETVPQTLAGTLGTVFQLASQVTIPSNKHSSTLFGLLEAWCRPCCSSLAAAVMIPCAAAAFFVASLPGVKWCLQGHAFEINTAMNAFGFLLEKSKAFATAFLQKERPKRHQITRSQPRIWFRVVVCVAPTVLRRASQDINHCYICFEIVTAAS